MRIAVIGAGMASAPHFQSLADLQAEGLLTWEWVVARDAGRLASLQLPAQPRRSTRLQDVLDDAGVKAALVLTPPNTHLDIARQLARAGKHVLVEKPLDITTAGAREVVAICAASGVQLAVMLQHRMADASRQLSNLLANGQIGQLISASASARWWRPQSYYDEPGRGTLARDGGGVLMTQAIHTLDLLLQYTGRPVEVCAYAQTSPAHRMECEDTVVAILRFEGGAMATLDATTAAQPGYPACITLNGTHGSMTLTEGNLMGWLTDGQHIGVSAGHGSGSGADPMAFHHGAHRAVLADFVHSILQQREPATSGRSALLVQQVIDALLLSARSGRPVAPDYRTD